MGFAGHNRGKRKYDGQYVVLFCDKCGKNKENGARVYKEKDGSWWCVLCRRALLKERIGSGIDETAQ